MKIIDVMVEEEFGDGAVAIHFDTVEEANAYIESNNGFNTLWDKLMSMGVDEDYFGDQKGFVHAIAQLQDLVEMDLVELLKRLIDDAEEFVCNRQTH